jgi:predicted AAA+ superfamily ATPase
MTKLATAVKIVLTKLATAVKIVLDEFVSNSRNSHARRLTIKRYLSKDIMDLALNRDKMAFVSGPRQVGKTTLAKSYKSGFDEFRYKNWDESEFRKKWAKSPNSLKDEFSLFQLDSTRLLILDEIHKSSKWKQKVKGLYDELNEEVKIIVTGSARLNTFKRGGDSLMGRYLSFRLHPFSYGEVLDQNRLPPDEWKANLFRKGSSVVQDRKLLDQLFKFSGFPEPFLAKSPKIQRIWRRGHNEKIVREDLRDLTRLPELSQIELLTSLLPEKVGNPLSVQSLREDIEVAHNTVSRWLRYLEELYFFFTIRPWTKSVVRSLKKEGKIYLFDWTEAEGIGSQFENMVASHLLKACHYWTDVGEGSFELYYLRNKEKQEIDFLLVKDRKPWIMVEAKIADPQISKASAEKFMSYLKCPLVQVVFQSGIWHARDNQLVCSFDRFACQLP